MQEITYVCKRCGRTGTDKADFVKRVVAWRTLGFKGTTLRTVTTGWYCHACMEQHPDYLARTQYRMGEYICDVDEVRHSPEVLVTKIVMWRDIGEHAKTYRSRQVGRFCRSHMLEDEDYPNDRR